MKWAISDGEKRGKTKSPSAQTEETPLQQNPRRGRAWRLGKFPLRGGKENDMNSSDRKDGVRVILKEGGFAHTKKKISTTQ